VAKQLGDLDPGLGVVVQAPLDGVQQVGVAKGGELDLKEKYGKRALRSRSGIDIVFWTSSFSIVLGTLLRFAPPALSDSHAFACRFSRKQHNGKAGSLERRVRQSEIL
jgi:hypothetical protein